MGKIILQWKKNYVIVEGKLVNCFYNWSNVFTTITIYEAWHFKLVN